MSALLEQVLKLLTTETGSLTYHLVLAFSVAGAFQLVLNQATRPVSSLQRRSLLGLGLLLALQLSLFAASGLAWQGLLNGPDLLPALDRAVTLLSLILIAWLWCFPDTAPLADTATLILAALAVAGSAFVGLGWSAPASLAGFNGSWPDQAAQVSCLIVGLLALVYLVAVRPEGWGVGVSMLAVILVGTGLHLVLPPTGMSYPPMVRLGLMVAFPFLLLLVQRLPGPSAGPTVDGALLTPGVPQPALLPLGADPQLWQSLLKLAAESEPDPARKELVALLARAFQADLVLLLQPPDADGRMSLSCGYDAHNNRYIAPLTLDGRALPMLSASLRMGRARRFAASSTSPDLVNLARLFGLERSGNLLFTPILAPDGRPVASLALLSPYSGRDWTPDEQSFLSLLARLLVHFLQRSQEMSSLQEEITRARSVTRQTQDQASLALDERQKLRDQVAVLQENTARDRQQLAELSSAAEKYAAAQQTIQQLQAELVDLSRSAEQASQASRQQLHILEGEMRLTLEEMAYLQASLAETDQKLTQIKQSQVEASPSGQQMVLIRQIAEDLRQPLGSIATQAESLLADSTLGVRPRKYVERIKVSTGRINRLLNDLIQAAQPESNPDHLEFVPLDLAEIVRRTARDCERSLREKHLALRLALPPTPLSIRSDPRALGQAVEQLLRNARTVTPQGGEVAVRARLESSDGEVDYVLLQVTDGGGGIAPQDLLQVFAPRTPGVLIPGLSDPAGEMPRLKSLVESLGGRTWVDSTPGQGVTFSLLLPAAPEMARPGGNGGRPRETRP